MEQNTVQEPPTGSSSASDESLPPAAPLSPGGDNQASMFASIDGLGHPSPRSDLGMGALYRDHQAFVRNCLRRYRMREDELDDAVQDVFTAMLGRAGEQLDRTRAVRPWLLGISRNMAFNARRRAARRTRLLERAPGPASPETPDEQVQRREASRLLERFLDRLDPDKLAPFVLLDIEGLPARDVAARLELPVTTVRWRARAARAELERLAGEQSPRRWASYLVWLWPWRSARLGPWLAWLVAAGVVLAVLGATSRPSPEPTAAAERIAASPSDRTTDPAPPRLRLSASALAPRPEAATIAGRVLDEDGHPIVDARVCQAIDVTERTRSEDVEPRCVRSDALGRYHLDGVTSGLHRIGASALGFLPADHPGAHGMGHLAVTPAGRHAGIDIVLRRGGGQVRGTVVDETGGVVSGALVRAQDFTRFGRGWSSVTTADEDGRFELWVPTGGVALSATADGYSTASGHANAPQDEVELRLMPEVVLAGRVVDRSGAPVTDIRVRANPEEHNADEIFAFTTTDAEGRFELRRLGPGRYRPTAEGPATFGQAAAFVTLAFGEPAPAVVITTAPAATVHVQVEAPAALDGCEGDWLEGFIETHRYAARISGSQGTLRGVPPGKLALVAFCRGQLIQQEIELPAVESFDATLRVEASAIVRGSVAIGEDGLGSYMSIRLVPEGKVIDGPMLPDGTVLTETDARGGFAAALPQAGSFEVVGSTLGGSTLPLASFTVKDGEQLELGELRLPALGHIEGRVVDPDGRGVGELRVRVLATAGLGGLTRADGTFSILQVVPGDYELDVRQQLVRLTEGTRRVTVAAGETTRVALTVPRLDGAITGVVVDADGEPVPDARVALAAVRPGDDEERLFRVVAELQADAEGRFSRADLRPGPYEVEVSALVGDGQGDDEDRPGCKGEARAEAKAGGSTDAVITCR